MVTSIVLVLQMVLLAMGDSVKGLPHFEVVIVLLCFCGPRGWSGNIRLVPPAPVVPPVPVVAAEVLVIGWSTVRITAVRLPSSLSSHELSITGLLVKLPSDGVGATALGTPDPLDR